MTTWHDAGSARALADLWPDVHSIDPTVLEVLLQAAREQVIAYAPTLPPYEPEGEDPAPQQIPARYALGQLRQAQNLWNAARVDSAGGFGDAEQFVVRPTPLDWHIKQILRPQKGRPRVR